jgi:hypothetical protein
VGPITIGVESVHESMDLWGETVRYDVTQRGSLVRIPRIFVRSWSFRVRLLNRWIISTVEIEVSIYLGIRERRL